MVRNRTHPFGGNTHEHRLMLNGRMRLNEDIASLGLDWKLEALPLENPKQFCQRLSMRLPYILAYFV